MKHSILRVCLPAVLVSLGVPFTAGAGGIGVPADTPSQADAAAARPSILAAADSASINGINLGKPVVALAGNDKKTGGSNWLRQIRPTGTIQTEFLFNEYDPGLKNDHFDQIVRNNTYFDFSLSAPYLAIGARFEFMKWPLPGFADQSKFAGWGVPYIWATANYKGYQLTVGDFYEQFGSGFILRAYQERSLGIDGALRGARFKMNPVNGFYFTALAGKQRFYWDTNPAWIWGADAEWALDESFAKAFGSNYGLSIGASYVGNHYKDMTVPVNNTDGSFRLNLPRNIAAFDGRVKLRLHNFNILAEFATKNNDPDAFNNYTYGRGDAEMLTVSYSQKGFSAFLQGKRSRNMGMFSNRAEVDYILNNGRIGFMPPFTMTQTYTLAAMYPYGTQYDGEWAFQGEVRYLFKKGTPLGGKYGTNVRASASYISGLDWDNPNHDRYAPVGSDGFSAPFWKIGALYYADLNVEINKKFTRNFSLTLFYLFQKYNMQVIRREPMPMVTANIFVLEGQHKLAKRTQLRWEAQYLHTKQDKGDWVCALVELSLAPHWMFTLTDTYNIGRTEHNEGEAKNYYKAMVTYNYKANRFTLGYGRTRAGYDCSGGVCRTVPATKGFTLTYSYHF